MVKPFFCKLNNWGIIKLNKLFVWLLKSTFLKLILLFVLLLSFSCSKDVSEPLPEATEKPTFTPDPDSISQIDIPAVDGAVVSFLEKYGVPGASIAVSVNEKMVYTKGYGLSNVENKTSTKYDDVFRVASLSKPFTATAVMQLIDEGKLSLDDTVFGANGILGNEFGSAVFTENELQITIDHLLIHGAGGWGTVSGDPIDQNPQMNSNEFIEYIINNWDLPNDPGDSYEYSNTGYWLLARIIEKISGLSYEEYVVEMVAKIGVTSFKTTNFSQEDREPNEVEYYGTAQDMPYIYSIAPRRDGDGGVVISAPDMLRFICGIDGREGRPDIVSPTSFNLMANPSEISNLGRGLGTWQEQNLLYFTGSLPGTRTWFYMDTNGKSAIIFLNYRRYDIPEFDNDLNTLVYNLVKDESIPWQSDLDQF